jgi:hypothetical protein
MMVSLGGLTGRGILRLLLCLALGKDFLQALSFKSHSSASGLRHLLCGFEPVRSHGHKDTLPGGSQDIFLNSPPFAKDAKNWARGMYPW